MNGKHLVLLFCVWLCAFSYPVEADQLQDLSLNIRQKLAELTKQSGSLQNELDATIAQLQEASTNLKLSEARQEELSQLSKNLQSSLDNMNQQSMIWYENSVKYKMELDRDKLRLTVAACILIGWCLIKLLAVILYMKGVKLPNWLYVLM